MNTKYTPAPWNLKSQCGDGWTRIMHNGKQIAKVNSIHPSGKREKGDFEQEEANARLIAAAPELLEALKWALDVMEIHKVGEGCGTQKAARAAILKAEG